MSTNKPTPAAIAAKKQRIERYYADKEYRKELLASTRFPSLEYVQLEQILNEEERIKNKLKLPQNSMIRNEKCYSPSNRRYYYAYIWQKNRIVQVREKTGLHNGYSPAEEKGGKLLQAI